MRFAKATSFIILSVMFLRVAVWAQQKAPQKGQFMTLTGEVVDAACFMIHPENGSTGKAHEDCGKACAAHSVPLAVLNQADKKLYFPADGNKQLASLRGKQVRVTGTVVDKSDPMELKMPAGDKNQMTVRIDGGYKMVTIASIAPAAGKAM